MSDDTPRTAPRLTSAYRGPKRGLIRSGLHVLFRIILFVIYLPVLLLSGWALSFGWAIYSVGQEQDVLVEALYEPAIQRPLVMHFANLALADALPGRHEDDATYLSAVWLPRELRDRVPDKTLANARITVSENEVHLNVSRGGWDHGWMVEVAVKQLDHEENRWGLFTSTPEDPNVMMAEPIFVTQFSGPGGYTRQEVLAFGLAGNERIVEGNPKTAYWNQITFNLWAGELKAARDACRSYYERIPDAWVPVLLWALVAEEANPGEGEALLRDWVAREPGFPRYVRLAQFYELIGRPDALADALLEATEHTEGDFRYFYARTYHTATFAMASGHPEATVAAADAMLNQIDHPEHSHWHNDAAHYNALKQAAHQVVSGTLSPNEAIPSLNPIGADIWGEGRHLDLPTPTPYTMLEQLLQRPVPRLTKDGVLNLP